MNLLLQKPITRVLMKSLLYATLSSYYIYKNIYKTYHCTAMADSGIKFLISWFIPCFSFSTCLGKNLVIGDTRFFTGHVFQDIQLAVSKH